MRALSLTPAFFDAGPTPCIPTRIQPSVPTHA